MVALGPGHMEEEGVGAVDHFRLVREVPGRVHEAGQLHHPLHPIEVAAAGRLHLGHDVDGAEPGGRLPVLQRQARAELALRSEEHTSELQSLMRISYAVFCLKKKNKQNTATSLDV